MEQHYLKETKSKFCIVWRIATDGKVWARIINTTTNNEFGKFKTKKDALIYLKIKNLI